MTVDMSPVIYRPSRPGPDSERGRPTRVPIAGPEIPTAASFAQDRGPEDQEGERASNRRPTKQSRLRRVLGRRDEANAPQVSTPEPSPDASATDQPAFDPFDVPEADRRRGRAVRMSPPPVGPGDPDEMADDDLPGATDVVAEEAMAQAVAADPPEDSDAIAEAIETTEHMVAITGRVRSTRLRGLRGMTVTVTDESDATVAEALTGRRGEFVIPDLPAGTYRLGARDAVDGDFSEGWHGSADAAHATWLRVDEHTSLPSVDVALTARVGIDADVTTTDDRAAIDIRVMDRSTGLPAIGEVVVSTEHFRAALPLTEGRTHITVLGASSGADAQPQELTSRVRIQYTGAEHSAPATRTLRLG